MTVEDLENMMVPDFETLDFESVEILVRTFNTLSNRGLRPLADPQPCSVRSAIDDAVSQALGIDLQLVWAIGEALAAEPSVTGNRFEDQPFIQQKLELEDLSTEHFSRMIEGPLRQDSYVIGIRRETEFDQTKQGQLF